MRKLKIVSVKTMVILMISCVGVLFVYNVIGYDYSGSDYPTHCDPVSYPRSEKSGKKKILMYTKYFGSKTWWACKDPQFYINTCPINQCVITFDKREYSSSHAVLFHARDLKSKHHFSTDCKKPLSPLWIWHLLENPYNVMDYSLIDNVFDVTSTYHQESEIFTPYFHVVKLKDSDIRADRNYNFALNKDRQVFAAVSHCGIKERITLIRSLSKYVQLDLYGKCAFEKNMTNGCPKTGCEDLKKRYRFSFAMENGYCKDYVTEKFYEALVKGLVPIVVGGKGQYNVRLAPPKSFIDVLDFNNIEELGNHLNYLIKNDSAYNEYHKWRYSYKIDQRSLICGVCEYLWNNQVSIENIKKGQDHWRNTTAFNLKQFWSVKKHCTPWKNVLERFL